jgi:DUF4097 and DUF4098 domain-containing protein YvlB
MRNGIVLLAGAILALAGPVSAGTGAHNEEFHQTYALSASGRVALENINGDVHITGWDRNEVKVDAIKRADAQERLDDAKILVDAGQNAVNIRTRYPDHFDHRHPASVEYTLTVPRGVRLDEIKLVNGALDIHGVSGDVRASSVNGAIKAENLEGDAKLSTVNGTLEAMFERLDPAKSVSIHSVNGSIVLSVPVDARADFKADTVSGGISNDFGFGVERERIIGRHLSAALKGGGTRIRLNNVKGSISIVPVWHGRRVRFT